MSPSNISVKWKLKNIWVELNWIKLFVIYTPALWCLLHPECSSVQSWLLYTAPKPPLSSQWCPCRYWSPDLTREYTRLSFTVCNHRTLCYPYAGHRRCFIVSACYVKFNSVSVLRLSVTLLTQLSGKYLSTISLIFACCVCNMEGQKYRQTYSMDAWVASAVLRCSGRG